jgi:hypothetical protein
LVEAFDITQGQPMHHQGHAKQSKNLIFLFFSICCMDLSIVAIQSVIST